MRTGLVLGHPSLLFFSRDQRARSSNVQRRLYWTRGFKNLSKVVHHLYVSITFGQVSEPTLPYRALPLSQVSAVVSSSVCNGTYASGPWSPQLRNTMRWLQRCPNILTAYTSTNQSPNGSARSRWFGVADCDVLPFPMLMYICRDFIIWPHGLTNRSSQLY